MHAIHPSPPIHPLTLGTAPSGSLAIRHGAQNTGRPSLTRQVQLDIANGFLVRSKIRPVLFFHPYEACPGPVIVGSRRLYDLSGERKTVEPHVRWWSCSRLFLRLAQFAQLGELDFRLDPIIGFTPSTLVPLGGERGPVQQLVEARPPSVVTGFLPVLDLHRRDPMRLTTDGDALERRQGR